MNTNIIKKHTTTIKLGTLTKILGFVCALGFSVAYGFYIVGLLQLQYSINSGDIGSYIHYFDATERLYTEIATGSDYAFRIFTLYLTITFDITSLTLLGYMAFTIATIVLFIYSRSIRSLKYLFPVLPLLLMVFLTPNVQFQFSSGIRSGIAFTFLLIALFYLKGIIKYIFFGISVLLHWSMLPMIALYFGFYILNNKRIKISFGPSLILLISGSILIAVVGSQVHHLSTIGSSIIYNAIISYVALLIIFINKKAVKNVYGFMSVGLMFIYLTGIIIGGDYYRYVGNAILLYLFFLISEGKPRTIQVFSAGYAPFFILTLFFAISNMGL